jgi:hypothetical protein
MDDPKGRAPADPRFLYDVGLAASRVGSAAVVADFTEANLHGYSINVLLGDGSVREYSDETGQFQTLRDIRTKANLVDPSGAWDDPIFQALEEAVGGGKLQ